jgi:hypothetical protein
VKLAHPGNGRLLALVRDQLQVLGPGTEPGRSAEVVTAGGVPALADAPWSLEPV